MKSLGDEDSRMVKDLLELARANKPKAIRRVRRMGSRIQPILFEFLLVFPREPVLGRAGGILKFTKGGYVISPDHRTLNLRPSGVGNLVGHPGVVYNCQIWYAFISVIAREKSSKSDNRRYRKKPVDTVLTREKLAFKKETIPPKDDSVKPKIVKNGQVCTPVRHSCGSRVQDRTATKPAG